MKNKIFKTIAVLTLCGQLGGCVAAGITVAAIEHKKKQAYREYVAETERFNAAHPDTPVKVKSYDAWKGVQ